MNFNIVEMDDLTGRMAHIYSILPEGEEFTLLEQFFEEIKQYKKESTTKLGIFVIVSPTLLLERSQCALSPFAVGEKEP